MERMSSFGSASPGAATDPSVHRSPILGYGGSKAARVRQPHIPWLTTAIEKHRRLLLAVSIVPLLISFNGRWRIGLDSSIYRGLARSIAIDHRYQFGDFGTHQIYPGFPVLLAGFTKLFGEHVFRPVAPLVMMVLMSLAIQ